MILAAHCPRCEEIRAKSRDLAPGEKPMAADFTPVEGQAPPVDGTPAICSKCNTDLVFRRMPPARENGHQQAPQAGITTLFALGPGEDIKQIKEIGPDVYIIFTNRRIVKINLNEVADG